MVEAYTKKLKTGYKECVWVNISIGQKDFKIIFFGRYVWRGWIQSMKNERKWLQCDRPAVGGQNDIISQQTNSKQEELWDQSGFQGFAELNSGDCSLLSHGLASPSYFPILIITSELKWSTVQSRDRSHKNEQLRKSWLGKRV